MKQCSRVIVYACTLYTTSLWQDVDIDLKKTNQESLLEAGGLLLINESLPSPEVPSLYTRIRSLQRLKVRLRTIVVLFFIIFPLPLQTSCYVFLFEIFNFLGDFYFILLLFSPPILSSVVLL